VVAPLRECLAPEDDVVLAYVFGSVARGRAGPLSDLDVAVLLADDADIGRRHLELIAALTSSIKSSEVDVVILNDAPVALAYRVLRDGRPIVNRNERVRVGHWVATVDRYLDMEPMRRMLAAGLQHRLEEGRLVDPDAVRRRLREIDRGSQDLDEFKRRVEAPSSPIPACKHKPSGTFSLRYKARSILPFTSWPRILRPPQKITARRFRRWRAWM